MKFTTVSVIAVALLCLYNYDMVKCACVDDESGGSGTPPCDMNSADAFASCDNGDGDCASGFKCITYYTEMGESFPYCVCPDSDFDNYNLGYSNCVDNNGCGNGLTCNSGSCLFNSGHACDSYVFMGTGLCLNDCVNGFCAA